MNIKEQIRNNPQDDCTAEAAVPGIQLCLVIVCAFLYRLYVMKYHPVMVPDFDGYQYIRIAKGIAKGTLISEAAVWSPLFPALIAIFSFLPFSLDMIGSHINIVLGTLTIIPIFYIVRILFSCHAAMVAAVAYAFSPLVAYNNVLVMSETSYIFTLFLTACIAARFLVSGTASFGASTMLGLFSAVGYYARPDMLLNYIALLPLIFISLEKETAARRGALLCFSLVVFSLAISPYVIFISDYVGKFSLNGKASVGLLSMKEVLKINDTGQGIWMTFICNPFRTASYMIPNIQIFLALFVANLNVLIVGFIIFIIGKFKGATGKSKILLFFGALLFPVLTNFLGGMDFRYFSMPMAVFSVISATGLSSAVELSKISGKSVLVRNLAYSILLLAVVCIETISLPLFLDRYDIRSSIPHNVRMYKLTGEWLRTNVPRNSVLFGSAYLLSYYSDLPPDYYGRKSDLKQTVEKMKSLDNAYMVVEPLVAGRCPELAPLMRPYSPEYRASELSKIFQPVYTDFEVNMYIYRFIGKTKDGA